MFLQHASSFVCSLIISVLIVYTFVVARAGEPKRFSLNQKCRLINGTSKPKAKASMNLREWSRLNPTLLPIFINGPFRNFYWGNAMQTILQFLSVQLRAYERILLVLLQTRVEGPSGRYMELSRIQVTLISYKR